MVKNNVFENFRFFGYFKNVFIKRVLYTRKVEKHCYRQDYRQSHLFRLHIHSQFSTYPSTEMLQATASIVYDVCSAQETSRYDRTGIRSRRNKYLFMLYVEILIMNYFCSFFSSYPIAGQGINSLCLSENVLPVFPR
jgi:hypothetical protein